MTLTPANVASHVRKIFVAATCERSLLEPDAWTEHAAFVCAQTNASCGMVLSVRMADADCTMIDCIVMTWPEEAIRRMRAVNAEGDPERTLLNRRGLARSGTVLTLDDVLDPAEQTRSQFINEVVVPAGLSNVLSLTTRMPHGRNLVMSLYFESRLALERYAPSASTIMKLLVDDVQMAVTHRLALAELRNTQLALDRLRMGVVLIDERCRVMTVNNQARQLLDRGAHLVVSDSKLVAVTTDATRSIRDIVSALVERGALNQGRDIVIHDRCGLPMQLTFMLLSSGPSQILTIRAEACVGCFISSVRDASPNPARLARVFQPFYGLSRAQAKVAALFSAGHQESEIATELRISRDTVHTHLAQASLKIRDVDGSSEGRKSLLVRLGEKHDNRLREE
jgi:DNA-binding CsgD family transcriptional regulator